MKKLTFTLLLALFGVFLQAQTTFTKRVGTGNDLPNHTTNPNYTGASWGDVNGDGYLDLVATPNRLYTNNQDSTFSLTIIPVAFGLGQGTSWGDVDNDGDLDLFVAASPCRFFRNNGGTLQLQQLTGTNISAFNGWSGTWGDYNRDGWLDLYVTHPAGFIGIPQPSFLFTGDGNGSFTRNTTGDPVTGQAAYTVGNWSDYDMDGDLDLFVGSGEVNFLSKDHIYINQLTETDTANLVRLQSGTIANDLRDGQNWNWIDYDNDGDFDGFVTNYFNSKTNDLYRNDDSVYVKMTVADVGNIVNQTGAGLCNLWADFDNDGDLDAYVNFDGQTDKYYLNNGDGTFTSTTTAFTIGGNARGATAGDFDNDGFLDLLVTSSTTGGGGLYQNDGNANNWVNILAEGTTSNRAGIGTKMKAKATINGQTTWQLREISAQNSFNGHNSLRVHFGFGDATVIDSLIVEWSLGAVDVFTNVPTNQFYKVIEGNDSIALQQFTTTTKVIKKPSLLVDIFPNPATDNLQIVFKENGVGEKRIRLFNALGQKVLTKLKESDSAVLLDVSHLDSGIYFLEIEMEKGKAVEKVVIE